MLDVLHKRGHLGMCTQQKPVLLMDMYTVVYTRRALSCIWTCLDNKGALLLMDKSTVVYTHKILSCTGT
jgi:hypothetical protein